MLAALFTRLAALFYGRRRLPWRISSTKSKKTLSESATRSSGRRTASTSSPCCYQRGQREAESERFTTALALVQAGRNADAANAFAELADEAGAGYRVLALFQRASAQLGSGDTAGAVATYDRIADDGGASAVLRDLGRLLAARALLDTAPAGEVEARLAPLRADANPWRHSARELTAVLALKAGDVAAAREGFQALADDLSAPSTTRARAAELLAALGGSS
jgi:hypothetical protein